MTKRNLNALLWVDDEPQNNAEIADDIKSAIACSIDYAVTISSAVRKLKKKSYVFLILDSLLPAGSEAILSNEVGVTIGSQSDAGGVLLEHLADGKLSGKIRQEKLRGVIFCSAVAVSARVNRVLKERKLPVLVLPKREIIMERTKAIQTLRKFCESCLLAPPLKIVPDALPDTLLVLQQRLDPPAAKKPADVCLADDEQDEDEVGDVCIAEVEQDEDEVGDVCLVDDGQDEDEVRGHIHQQNQVMHKIVATQGAAIDLISKYVLEYEKSPLFTYKEILYKPIEEIELEIDALVDVSATKDLRSLDEIDDLFGRLKRAVDNTPSSNTVHIRRLLEEMQERAGRRFSKLQAILDGALKAIVFAELSASLKDVRSMAFSAIEDNNRFIDQMYGGVDGHQSIEELDLVQFMDARIRNFEPKANKRNCHIRRYACPPIVMRLNHVDLNTVVNNLLDNAIKHSFMMPTETAWIVLQLTSNGDGTASLSVESWGAQIKRNEDIYAANERGSESLASGSGQGLYISKKCCERNNWSLTHTSVQANPKGRATRVQRRVAYINTFTVVLHEH
ncbi:MAG: HAMP domain-containing histidine kinase [Alphaproteobacteria bacterium]|nr:MAG: HAMP domain-containing histidine kinase [Alphaproteobacteria bacterium]